MSYIRYISLALASGIVHAYPQAPAGGAPPAWPAPADLPASTSAECKAILQDTGVRALDGKIVPNNYIVELKPFATDATVQEIVSGLKVTPKITYKKKAQPGFSAELSYDQVCSVYKNVAVSSGRSWLVHDRVLRSNRLTTLKSILSPQLQQNQSVNSSRTTMLMPSGIGQSDKLVLSVLPMSKILTPIVPKLFGTPLSAPTQPKLSKESFLHNSRHTQIKRMWKKCFKILHSRTLKLSLQIRVERKTTMILLVLSSFRGR